MAKQVNKPYICPRCEKTGGIPRLFFFEGITYIICSNTCRDKVMVTYG